MQNCARISNHTKIVVALGISTISSHVMIWTVHIFRQPLIRWCATPPLRSHTSPKVYHKVRKYFTATIGLRLLKTSPMEDPHRRMTPH